MEGVSTEKHPSHIEILIQLSYKDMNFSISARNMAENPLCTEGNYALSNIKCHP
jgi:hypothetical protein